MRLGLALILALSLSGCRPTESPTPPPVSTTEVTAASTEVSGPLPAEVEVPAGASSRLPGMSAGADGRLHLAWLEPGAEGAMALVTSSWDGQAWAEPETVASGEGLVEHWTASPSIAAGADGSRALQWLTSSTLGGYGTDVQVAVSAGPGAAWQPAAPVHEPARNAENGFAQVLPGPAGFELLWLDAAAQEATPGTTGEAPEVRLRHVSLDKSGQGGAASEVDGRVCDCCAVDAVSQGGEVLASFRDRSPDEVRDIALSRFAGGQWSAPHIAHADGWQVEACPVNGPALDLVGEKGVLAWYTAAPGQPPRVLVAWTADGGESFGEPLQVDDGRPAGQVDAVLLADGSALVSWLEGGDLWVRRLSADGATRTVAARVPEVSYEAGRPRLERQGETVWLSWADVGAEGRVHLGLVNAR